MHENIELYMAYEAFSLTLPEVAAQLHAAYRQLACGWWVYLLQRSISTVVTSTNTGVTALRNYPLGSFESQNNSGSSFHPTTQKSRGELAECPVLPFLLPNCQLLPEGTLPHGP